MIDILVSKLIIVCSSKHTMSPVPVRVFQEQGGIREVYGLARV